MSTYLRSILRTSRRLVGRMLVFFRLAPRPRTTELAAQRYWTDDVQDGHDSNSHVRGAGPFRDDSRWLGLGERHFLMYEQFARAVRFRRPVGTIVEWGCGGGANALRFAEECSTFIGVDVSPSTLTECGRELSRAGFRSFVPVQIDIRQPEAALDVIRDECDLYICTYVFELIPHEEYGARLLKVARDLLRSGGLAIVQIKYRNSSYDTRSRRFNYRGNLANMTTYSIDEFWVLSESVGFSPEMIQLVPRDRYVGDERYAYFLLRKP